MKNIIKNLNKLSKIFLLFFIVVIFSASGFLLVRVGFYNYDLKKVIYKENKKIDYKVFLKENDFFDNEYLGMNRTYIASLIDYIDIDFNYDVILNEKLSGSYSYYIKGIVEANDDSTNSNYYTKEYALTDVKVKKYDKSKKINIKENIKIDYDVYNDLLNSFKDEFNVSMNGILKVVLVINNNVDKTNYFDKQTKNAEMELKIPLTSLTIDVPIDAKNNNSSSVLTTYKIYKEGLFYPFAKVLGIFCYVVAFLSVIYLVYLTIISYKLESLYYKKLRKILRIYDGVIVNLNNMPNIDKTKVINVSNFEELIDAHSEIRHPINYIKEKDGAVFLLISDGYVYFYKLRREVLSKGCDLE